MSAVRALTLLSTNPGQNLDEALKTFCGTRLPERGLLKRVHVWWSPVESSDDRPAAYAYIVDIVADEFEWATMTVLELRSALRGLVRSTVTLLEHHFEDGVTSGTNDAPQPDEIHHLVLLKVIPQEREAVRTAVEAWNSWATCMEVFGPYDYVIDFRLSRARAEAHVANIKQELDGRATNVLVLHRTKRHGTGS